MNEYSHLTFTKYFFDDPEIIKGCTRPDIDETQNAFDCHFYNPVTRRSYKGSEDSAKNRFFWHLSEHLQSGSMMELGRAIHFIEDICTPVHTQYEDAFDSVLRLNLHVDFEKKLDNFLSSSQPVNREGLTFSSNLSHAIDEISCFSARNYYVFRNQKQENQSFNGTFNLTFSALNMLKGLLQSKGISSYKYNNEINIIKHCGNAYSSTIDSNTCLRPTHNGLFIFRRENHISNFKLDESVDI